MENGRAEKLLQILKDPLDVVKQERDAPLLEVDEQKAKVEEEYNTKIRISKLPTVSRCAKRRLESDLIIAGEEAAKERKTREEAHRIEMYKEVAMSQYLEARLLESESREAKLEEELLHSRDNCEVLESTRETVQENLEDARADFRKLEVEMLEAEIKVAKLEKELLHSRDNCKELETTLKNVQEILEEEKEKTLRPICFESPKDSVLIPCLHFNYCFSCLELQGTQNQTCPTCRTTIVEVLKCVGCA